MNIKGQDSDDLICPTMCCDRCRVCKPKDEYKSSKIRGGYCFRCRDCQNERRLQKMDRWTSEMGRVSEAQLSHKLLTISNLKTLRPPEPTVPLAVINKLIDEQIDELMTRKADLLIKISLMERQQKVLTREEDIEFLEGRIKARRRKVESYQKRATTLYQRKFDVGLRDCKQAVEEFLNS